MKALSLKVPPVAVFLIAVGLILLCSHQFSWAYRDLPFRIGAVVVSFLSAGYLGLGGLYEFYKAKTTVNPVNPEQASMFVCRGVYRISRNPMYLGLCVLLLGYTYWLGNLSGLVVVWVFVIYMNFFQIMPEERALERLFGQEYLAYKQQVRRWI